MKTPPEVVAAFEIVLAVSGLTVVGLLWFGRRWSRLRPFREWMVAQWKPALGVTLLYLLSYALGARQFNPFGGIMTFCQVMLGLALARGIAGFEPLPVTAAILWRDHPWRKVFLFILISGLIVPLSFIAGMLGHGIGQGFFHEVSQSGNAQSQFPGGPFAVFFLLLAGAGIAEETMYRLIVLSLLWRWAGRRWPAILLSAIVFGLYHLTPLDGMYQTFWHYPLIQFFSTFFVGIVTGYFYVKRGYETVVLGHTLSDWLPFLIMSLSH